MFAANLANFAETKSWYGEGTELVRSGSSIRFVIWYIENGISYKVGLDIWLIEIIFLILHS